MLSCCGCKHVCICVYVCVRVCTYVCTYADQISKIGTKWLHIEVICVLSEHPCLLSSASAPLIQPPNFSRMSMNALSVFVCMWTKSRSYIAKTNLSSTYSPLLQSSLLVMMLYFGTGDSRWMANLFIEICSVTDAYSYL